MLLQTVLRLGARNGAARQAGAAASRQLLLRMNSSVPPPRVDHRIDASHFRATPRPAAVEEPWCEYGLSHPVWTNEEMDGVQITHLPPYGFVDRAAYASVMTLRRAYDFFTGYTFGRKDEACMLRRIIVLETVAGVPGMVGAMIRHYRSLRKMERDFGWIHTLLEEAENERMHLMMALVLRSPSLPIRLAVLGAQGFFLTFYTIMYALTPKYCHRFVGYLEEEAVKTYTALVELIDCGKLPGFTARAPPALRQYYQLPEEATLRDVFLCMRADEGHHREVNHILADMRRNDLNPFPPGY